VHLYINTMFRWLWGSTISNNIQILLSAFDESARSMPGFYSGNLTLTATSGETLQQVLNRFNKYRGPDSQITNVYTSEGEIVPLFTVLTESVTLFVKNAYYV
jgi:hypothetical protein